jgi:hypothetical protein
MIGAALRSMAQPYLDLTLRSGPDLRVRIVERPGLWMELGQPHRRDPCGV